MRIRDWSSDVCSSDLHNRIGLRFLNHLARVGRKLPLKPPAFLALVPGCLIAAEPLGRPPTAPRLVIRSEQGAMPFFEHFCYPVIPLRSEERRVGNACVTTFSSRWSP